MNVLSARRRQLTHLQSVMLQNFSYAETAHTDGNIDDYDKSEWDKMLRRLADQCQYEMEELRKCES